MQRTQDALRYPSSAALLDEVERGFEDALARTREGLLVRPEAALTRRPAPRKWSAIDCLEHLARAHRVYLPHLTRAIQRSSSHGARPDEPFRPGWVGERMVRALAPSAAGRIPLPMPTLRSADPARDPDGRCPSAEASISSFVNSLEEILSLVERSRDYDLHVRSQTLLGPALQLRIGDVFRYLLAHVERHLLQAERAADAAEGGSTPPLTA